VCVHENSRHQNTVYALTITGMFCTIFSMWTVDAFSR